MPDDCLLTSALTDKRTTLGDALEIHARNWPALESGAPFTPDCDPVSRVTFKRPAFLFGGGRPLKIHWDANGATEIQLQWPEEGVLLARLVISGSLDAGADAALPAAPFSAKFGLEVGRRFTLERSKRYSASLPARAVVEELLGGALLPRQVDHVAAIPAEGETLVSSCGGYLSLNGAISYGFEMSGSQDFTAGALQLDLNCEVRGSLDLKAGYKVQGDFRIEAVRGAKPGFARFIVRRAKSSAADIGGAFGFTAKLKLDGLPDTAEEFLQNALGTHAGAILRTFAKARKYASIDELEKGLGKLAVGAAREWAHSLIGEALTEQNVARFAEEAAKVARAYVQLDGRVVRVLHAFTGREQELSVALAGLRALETADELRTAAGMTVSPLVRELCGAEVYDVLLAPSAFDGLRQRVRQLDALLSNAGERKVLESIGKLQQALPFDAILSKISAIEKPEDLARLTDPVLQGAVERLTGKAFEQLRGGKAGAALKDIKAALDRVENFKNEFSEKLRAMADSRLCLSAALAYSRSTAAGALVDIELDLNDPKGCELARKCGAGDFAEAIEKFYCPFVRLNEGSFTREALSSGEFKAHLFGLERSGLTKLLQRSTEALRSHGNGLLHVYCSETILERERRRRGETTVSTFLMATAAQALQLPGAPQAVLRAMPELSCACSLTTEDLKTEFEEMAAILDFGEKIGLLDSGAAAVERLRREFPGGFGRVKADYVVRYAPAEVARAFSALGSNLAPIARRAIRTYVAALYSAMPKNHHMAVLGPAYLNDALFKQFTNLGPAAFPKRLPGLPGLIKQDLTVLYQQENDFVEALEKLRKFLSSLDGPATADRLQELDKLTGKFVAAAPGLDFGREHTFFVVFDALIRAARGDGEPAGATLVLEITPEAGETVRKVFSARPAQPAG